MFKGFQEIPSGEAARTRLVAKRSLNECGMVSMDVATEMGDEWSRVFVKVEAVVWSEAE